jgi:hypothetical protein
MTTEAWVQILIAVSIIAIIFLVVVFYRLTEVLADVKTVTEIASKRAKEIDARIDLAEKKMDSVSEMLKGFMASLDIIKIVREKFKEKESKK